MAFDLVIQEAECTDTSNCVPFGLIDSIEPMLLDASGRPVKGVVDVSKVRDGRTEINIINLFRELK